MGKAGKLTRTHTLFVSIDLRHFCKYTSICRTRVSLLQPFLLLLLLLLRFQVLAVPRDPVLPCSLLLSLRWYPLFGSHYVTELCFHVVPCPHRWELPKTFPSSLDQVLFEALGSVKWVCTHFVHSVHN